MPVENAVDVMWLQPQTTVGWTWLCRPANAQQTDEQAAPPLYFWFIPLASRSERAALSVSRGRTHRNDNDSGGNWAFEWQIANRGARPLPLKINVWTPVGAQPCAATS